MCRFCREDQSFEETAIRGKPKLCRSGKGSGRIIPRLRAEAGAACSILAARAGGLLGEGVRAASDNHRKADAVGHHRVKRVVTGKGSRGCYRASRLTVGAGTFMMVSSVASGVAWLLAGEPLNHSPTSLSPYRAFNPHKLQNPFGCK